MVYNHKFVAVVKSGNKIVREKDNDVVELPLGSNYSIYLKNKNSVGAVVSIEIDGQDVLSDNQLYVGPNQEFTLNGHMDSGGTITNKFKFIEKTSQISDHRGDKIDDGMIRISWRYEEQKPIIKKETIIHEEHIYRKRRHYPLIWEGPWYGDVTCSNMDMASADDCFRGEVSNLSYSVDAEPKTPKGGRRNDKTFSSGGKKRSMTRSLKDGITVKGQEINEETRKVTAGKLEEQEHAIVLHLRGYTETEKPVKVVKTTRQKITCPTCGTKCRSSMKYCSNCGTHLG